MGLPPSRFATLATRLQDADDGLRRDFANLTLEALLETYERELQRAAADRPRDAEARRKLHRWQRATGGLIAELEAARRTLLAGAPLTLVVEREREVLLIIGGRAVSTSGPRAETGENFGEQVVAQFCAFNDCGGYALEAPPQPTPAATAAEGLWFFGQGLRPSYQIGERFRFDFDQLGDRAEKAARCDEAARELERLAEAIRQSGRQGHAIERQALAANPPAPGVDQRIVLNTGGDYLRLHLPLLARLEEDDWRRVAEWLAAGNMKEAPLLHIRGAQRLAEE